MLVPRMFVCLALGVAASLVGCSSSDGSSTSSSGAPASGLGAQARTQLAACRAGTDENTFDDALEITTDFKESCHELVVCGGIGHRLVGSILEVFLNAALGTGEGSLTFEGSVYRSTEASAFGTTMEITLVAPKDTSFAKAGEPIPYDLQKVDSFFTSATLKTEGAVSTSGVNVKVKVKYEALGPAFELLGLTAPSGPGEVTLDAKEMQRALGAIRLRAKTHVDDKKGHAAFLYDMTTPETTLESLFGGGAMGFTLDQLTGGRAEHAQTLQPFTFDVTYVDGKAGRLDGTIAFDVKGGALPHKATFHYPRANDPEITFACP